MHCGDEPKRVFWFRKLLFLFSNAGKQTKPSCFFGKGHSGGGRKAGIEGCLILGRSNMGVLLWPKRHTGMPLKLGVTHVRPSWWPPPEETNANLKAKFLTSRPPNSGVPIFWKGVTSHGVKQADLEFFKHAQKNCEDRCGT
jgi:hypothetical protein